MTRRFGKLLATTAVMLLGACGLDAPAVDYGDPTVGSDGLEGIALALESPTPFSTVTTATVTAEIGAAHASGIDRVEYTLNGGPWERAVASGDATYLAPLGFRFGINDLRLRATAGDGTRRIVDVTLTYEGAAPTVVITAPTQGGYAGIEIAVAGHAAAAEGTTLTGVDVQVDDGAWMPATVTADGSFSATVPGTGAQTQTVRARATDATGATATTEKTLTNDSTAPQLTVETPTDAMITRDAVIPVIGTAADETALARVEVQVGNLGWIVAPLDAAGRFETTVGLAPAENSVQVRSIDAAGNTTTETLRVYRSRLVTLSPVASGADDNLLTLTLNKAGLQELIPPEDAASLEMLYLDMSGLLVEALRAMKDYQTYNVDTSAWGPAEWNMHNILTMSPDSADVTGTSLEEILTLSQNLGIPVPVVLGDLADIAPTDPFLTTEEIAAGVFETILSPHPGLVTDPADGVKKIPITLGDAFEDLVTLADKLGPQGQHPGILFAASPAPVLLPNFAMTVTARSNLRQHDGLDLGSGKTYVFARRPGDEALDFDFLNPEWFQVQGLADEPEVDLSFLITEEASFIAAGTAKSGNAQNGFERGNSSVWQLPTWRFEYLVAQTMFEVYHPKFEDTANVRTFSYDVGSLQDAAVIQWDRGWLSINTLGGVGEPPPPQYFWDAVLELAQVRLHDGGLSEGEANLRLVIEGVRVPLTAEELVEATRPVLEAQKATMAELMVGDQSTYSSTAELFLATGADGKPYLYYIDAADVPGLGATHPTRGLFSDAGLTTKVSTTDDLGSGDTVHEKVAVDPAGGQVYYAAGLDGAVWKLKMEPSVGGDVKMLVEPGGAW